MSKLGINITIKLDTNLKLEGRDENIFYITFNILHRRFQAL